MTFLSTVRLRPMVHFSPQICNAVVVARLLNAVLILPALDVNPVWNDDRSDPDLCCTLFNCSTGMVTLASPVVSFVADASPTNPHQAAILKQ